MQENDDDQIAKGFDRGVDFEDMKQRLIDKYEEIYGFIGTLDTNDKTTFRININKLIYLHVAMTQLKNGSRISEACKAFRLFIKNKNFMDKVVVKISKSECIKYKKETKEMFVTKRRNRQMKYPSDWVFLDYEKSMEKNLDGIDNDHLQQRVLDFMLKNFQCNTHSLRYSFINYMLFVKKKEMALVAKFVGHTDVNNIVRYTQTKNLDHMFDMDI
jgi:integrase